MNTPLIVLLIVADLIIVYLVLRAVFSRVSGERARALQQRGALLLDVRTPEEFQAGHLKGAVNVPYQDVAARIGELSPNKSAPLLVYCKSGGRSGIARSTLRRMGYSDAHNLGSLERARQLLQS